MLGWRRRSPHGERGLKSRLTVDLPLYADGRSPHGERGLKSDHRRRPGESGRRSPHGERGLKSTPPRKLNEAGMSLSSWRAWIEIHTNLAKTADKQCRSPHGERGLKSGRRSNVTVGHASLSSWRAWIEMCRYGIHPRWFSVALLMESVD